VSPREPWQPALEALEAQRERASWRASHPSCERAEISLDFQEKMGLRRRLFHDTAMMAERLFERVAALEIESLSVPLTGKTLAGDREYANKLDLVDEAVWIAAERWVKGRAERDLALARQLDQDARQLDLYQVVKEVEP